MCQGPAIDVLQLTAQRNAMRDARDRNTALAAELADVMCRRLTLNGGGGCQYQLAWHELIEPLFLLFNTELRRSYAI